MIFQGKYKEYKDLIELSTANLKIKSAERLYLPLNDFGDDIMSVNIRPFAKLATKLSAAMSTYLIKE